MSYLDRLPTELHIILEHYRYYDNHRDFNAILHACFPPMLHAVPKDQANECFTRLKIKTRVTSEPPYFHAVIDTNLEDVITDKVLSAAVRGIVNALCVYSSFASIVAVVNTALRKTKSNLRVAMFGSVRDGKYMVEIIRGEILS